MTYLVFARKWRPVRFDEVVAQPHVTETLAGALASGKAGHAYLFTGPRGVGKTTTARILAKALNCVHGPTPTPCGTCEQCVAIADGRHLDVIEIDGASNRSIDDVRALRETVMYTPAQGRAKVYIIDEVHMLTTEAFNALLKTLEEPPDHVTFILATTDPHRVPDTILSRCQRFDFKRIPATDIVDAITRIAEKEGLTLDPDAAALLAEKADGSLRDSLSLLDQVCAYSGGHLTAEAAAQVLGLVDRKFLLGMIAALRDSDAASALDLLGGFIDGGGDMGEFVASLARHLRTLTALRLGSKHAGAQFSADERDELMEAARVISIGDLVRMSRMSADLGTMLRKRERAFEPRVMVEMLLVRLATMDSTVQLADVLASIGTGRGIPSDDLFADPEGAARPAPRPRAEAERSAPPVKRAAPESPAARPARDDVSLDEVRSRWSDFCDALDAKAPMRFSALHAGRPAALVGDALTVALPNGGQMVRDELSRPESARLVASVAEQVFGRAMSIECTVEQTAAREDEREEDPAVSLALDMFGARVVARKPKRTNDGEPR